MANKYLEKIATYYEKNSTFSFRDKTYDMNSVFKDTVDAEVNHRPVSELKHLLLNSWPTREKRTERADPSVPILICETSNGRQLLVDGRHRLTKAVKYELEHIPVKRVSEEMMERALINEKRT